MLPFNFFLNNFINRQILTSYAAATSGAIVTAVGLNRMANVKTYGYDVLFIKIIN